MHLLESTLQLLLDTNQWSVITAEIERLAINEENTERRHLLAKMAQITGMNCEAENRDQDPQWFRGSNFPISVDL